MGKTMSAAPENSHQKGFTLLELMIVVAIIGILNAIAIPNFLRYRQQAYEAAIRAEAKMFWMSAHAYFIDEPGAVTASDPPAYNPNKDIETEGAITLNRKTGKTGGAVIFRHKETDKVGKLDGRDGFIYMGYSS